MKFGFTIAHILGKNLSTAWSILRDGESSSEELSIQEGLLLRGRRIVIPTNMRAEVLAQLPTGHQGISKCRAWAKQSVWWPGLSQEMEKVV